MDLFKAVERLMVMDDRVWDRHANPMSGWSRVIIGPLLVFFIFARVWLGWWVLVPIAVLLFWTWWNPRAFPPPADHDSWMARGVIGERWYLVRTRINLPEHHIKVSNLLTALAVLGVVPLVYGLWVLDPGWTIAGAALCFYPRFWFIDRMNWIVQDMTGNAPGTAFPIPDLPPKETQK